MNSANVFAIAVLLVLCVICAWGAFSSVFKDNLLQRVGMVVTLFGCVSLIHYIWDMEYLPRGALTLLTGVLFFAMGTMVKVVVHHRKSPRHGYYHRLHH